MAKVSSTMDRRLKERLIGATILVVLIVLIVPELLTGPRPPEAPPLTVGQPAASRNVSIDLATSRATPAPQALDGASATAVDASELNVPAGAATPGGTSPDATASGAAASDAAASDTAASNAAASLDSPGPTRSAPPTIATLRAQEESPPTLESPPSSPKISSRVARPRAAGEVPTAGAQAHHGWAVQLGSFVRKANAEKLAHQLKTRGSSVYVISSGSGPSLRYRVLMGPMADREAAERTVGKLKAEGQAATIVTPPS
jgi:DedD protein